MAYEKVQQKSLQQYSIPMEFSAYMGNSIDELHNLFFPSGIVQLLSEDVLQLKTFQLNGHQAILVLQGNQYNQRV